MDTQSHSHTGIQARMQNRWAASFLLMLHLQPRCALDRCCWVQDVLHSLCGTCEAFLWAVRLAALVCVSWGSVCLGPLLADSRGLGTSVSMLICGRCRVLNQVVRGNSGIAGGRHWQSCVVAQPNITSSLPNILCCCICHSWCGGSKHKQLLSVFSMLTMDLMITCIWKGLFVVTNAQIIITQSLNLCAAF